MNMHKLLVLSLVAWFTTTLQAQTTYDVAPLMQSHPYGTARFVAMGGAMSALGGDITTISTNPAGIGIFRSNDISTTLSYNNFGQRSRFNGITTTTHRSHAAVDQIGFVLSCDESKSVYDYRGNYQSQGTCFLNFAFNYQRIGHFNRKLSVMGELDGFSQTDYMAYQTANSGTTLDAFSHMANTASAASAYNNATYGWLSVMGARTGLVDGVQTTDDAGNTFEGYYGWLGKATQHTIKTTGGVDKFDFCTALNILNRFYMGVTVGIYSVDYSRYSSHYETLYRTTTYGTVNAEYALANWYSANGLGTDAKVGIIYRPLEDSSLRIGLAVHTPILWNITERYSAIISTRYEAYDDEGNLSTHTASSDTYDGVGGDAENDYELSTPWTYNLSVGYTVGRHLALGAEYAYTAYGSATVADGYGHKDGYAQQQNSAIKQNLQGVHVLRLGAEYKPLPAVSLRAGYNYTSAMFQRGAYKALAANATRTDSEYTNTYGQHTLSLGAGYRWADWYLDAAYLLTTQRSDFYFYDDAALPATKLKETDNRLLVTVGMKF